MPFFSSIFKTKDGAGTSAKSKKRADQNGAAVLAPPKPRWEDAWLRKEVEPEEVHELLRGCTYEMKSRALDLPFLLLPFRPTSDPSAARSFVRNYFGGGLEQSGQLRGEHLQQELRLTEPMVLCSVMKWCWSRLPRGVVTWEAYELFRIGEHDSNMARDAFATFIPISVESDARTNIIFDFFDLMAAVAAHGRTNGLGGRKLSRLAGWWAFEHTDAGNGFDGGYKSWASAADATSHLFFAYLRSLTPDSVKGINGISTLPLSLQALAQETEYPPETPSSMQTRTTKVVMIVDSVSPTPFALLRRAKHFEYRDDDRALQKFADYEDPIQALTDECRRVLKCISSTNQSQASSSKASTGLRDASWSRFEDIGFGGLMDDSDNDEVDGSALGKTRHPPEGLRSTPHSRTQDFGRPTTPSWADFLSSGFVDEPGNKGPKPLLLPPDKILPPINTSRGQSSQSHKRAADDGSSLEPGELASINAIDLDDSFWWVWITSLAGEEPTERKAVFGRCALIETNITGGKWLVMEEMVKGAAPEPEAGAYIAAKKSRFGFTKRGRRKSTGKKNQILPPEDPYARTKHNPSSLMSKTSIGPDQHARIQAAAAALQQKQKHQDMEQAGLRRGREDDAHSTKTNSVFTLQPVIMSEAAPAMKWANSYDKDAVRAAYLGNNFAGRGMSNDMLPPGGPDTNGMNTNGTPTPGLPTKDSSAPGFDYGFPRNVYGLPRNESGLSRDTSHDRDLPALPREKLEKLAPETPPEEQMPAPSPAPLPASPAGNFQQYNRAASEAAEIPLPATTPMEQPRKMGRKPLRPLNQPQAQLAEDSTTADYPKPMSPEQATADDLRSASFSSERKSPPGQKLKKRGGGGGLKGFFGRKRMDLPGQIVASQADNEAALAAARAALQGPQHQQNGLVPPPQSTLSRRFSGVRKKSSPNAVPLARPPAPPMQDIDDEPAVSTTEVTPLASPSFEPPPRHWHDSQQSLSGVDSNEKRKAAQEFSTFDQGPLQDQPAIMPQDSPQRGSSEFATPAENEMQHGIEHDRVQDDISERSIELGREISPLQDRWAQIRKNAAERAARQSEEQSKTYQTERNEEGDTSGEETIESRVARIKARVAELTGNMDGAAP
ncbi:MAG: hypothetical protein M1830_000623, partial [Pleopsidium flavum]